MLEIYNDVCFDKNHFRREFCCIFSLYISAAQEPRKYSAKSFVENKNMSVFVYTYGSAKSFIENLEWCLFWCSRTPLTFGENFRWKWNVCFCLHAYLRKFNKPWDRSTRNYLQIKIPTMTCGWFLKFGWMCNCL